MPTLKNINPMGEVGVPGVGELSAGQEFDVTDAQAKVLLDQPDNYKLVTPPKKKDEK